MRKILWLASWYPDSKDPYDGDFVQRHAKALATQTNVHVICVKSHQGIRANEFNRYDNLTEDVRFYTRSNVPLLGGLINATRYLTTGLTAINEYKRKHGKPDLVHVHVLMKAGMLGWWLKVFHGIPFVVTEHYNIYHKARPDSFFNRSAVYQFAVRKILEASSGLISVSNYIAQHLQQIAPPLKSVWVPNTVDTDLFHPDKTFHQPVSISDRSTSEKPFTFVHASTMHPVKNIDGMLQAVKQLSQKRNDFRLKLFGLNPNGAEQKIRELQIEHVVSLNGKASYEKVAEETRNADALLMFSRWENMPCNILEALCCGLPVVASRVGGIPEVVTDTNGILVDHNDVNALVEAMNTLIENRNRYNKQQIASQARQQFGYEAIGKRFVSVYNKIVPTFPQSPP